MKRRQGTNLNVESVTNIPVYVDVDIDVDVDVALHCCSRLPLLVTFVVFFTATPWPGALLFHLFFRLHVFTRHSRVTHGDSLFQWSASVSVSCVICYNIARVNGLQLVLIFPLE